MAWHASIDAFPCGSLSAYKAMALSPDGSLLALAAQGSDTVVLFERSSTGLLWRGMLAGAAQGIRQPVALAFSPDSRFLAVGLKDSGLALVDCSASPSLVALRGAESGLGGELRGLAFSPWLSFPAGKLANQSSPFDAVIAVGRHNGLALYGVVTSGMFVELAAHAYCFSQADLALDSGGGTSARQVGRLGWWQVELPAPSR